ncbi:MAG: hypothetical protein GXO83_00805 [Chlorobi bacterium]|nr:hypothetical protein [Chlorobiota bacterium]
MVQPKRSLDILILDKTVPSLERNKHRSFNWILTHNKYVKSDNHRYAYTKDYYGFFPLKPLRSKKYDTRRIRLTQILELADSIDMAYYTDTYGVYFNDWYKGISKARRSRMIYGGLNNNDRLLLKEMKDRKKLIIGEYNILAYPTAPLDRANTEEIFNIKWTEWLGAYFSTLDTIQDTQFPKWILQNYRDQYHKSWDFKNAGVVFVNYNSRVVVLESGTHLDFDMPYIYTSKYGREKYGLPHRIAFPYWFEVLEPGNNRVVSTFKIHTNTVGDSVLDAHFLPNEFPAVIESTGDAPYYYFAGDFANNPEHMRTSYFYHVEKLNNMIKPPFLSKRRHFFWHFYYPLMTNILDQYYYDTMEKKDQTKEK